MRPDAWRLDPQHLDVACGVADALFLIQQAVPADVLLEVRNQRVVQHGERRENARCTPFLSEQGQLVALGLDGVGDDCLRPVDRDTATAHAAQAEQRLNQLTALSADQAADAEDFTLPHLEGDIPEGTLDARREVLDLEHDVARRILTRRKHVRQRPADHLADDEFVVEGIRLVRPDQPTVAHDGHLVGDLENLLDAVRDVNDGDSLAAQFSDDGEEVLDLVLREGRCRLIHDDDARVVGHCLRNLHGLNLGGRQVHDLRRGVDVHAQVIEHGLAVRIHLAVVHDPDDTIPLLGVASQPEVLHDAALGNRQEFLLNHGNTRIQSLPGVCEADRVSFQHNLPCVRLVDAKRTFHERRLPGAVLANQGMH